jgi:hypothetical protein
VVLVDRETIPSERYNEVEPIVKLTELGETRYGKDLTIADDGGRVLVIHDVRAFKVVPLSTRPLELDVRVPAELSEAARLSQHMLTYREVRFRENDRVRVVSTVRSELALAQGGYRDGTRRVLVPVEGHASSYTRCCSGKRSTTASHTRTLIPLAAFLVRGSHDGQWSGFGGHAGAEASADRSAPSPTCVTSRPPSVRVIAGALRGSRRSSSLRIGLAEPHEVLRVERARAPLAFDDVDRATRAWEDEVDLVSILVTPEAHLGGRNRLQRLEDNMLPQEPEVVVAERIPTLRVADEPVSNAYTFGCATISRVAPP